MKTHDAKKIRNLIERINNKEKNISLMEGRDAPLYHGTNIIDIGNIIKDSSINGETYLKVNNKEYKGVSLTRDYKTALKFTHFVDYEYTNNENGFNSVIVLDQRKLSQMYKIFPINYWETEEGKHILNTDFDDDPPNFYTQKHSSIFEFEEFLVGDIKLTDDILISVNINDANFLNLENYILKQLNRPLKRMMAKNKLNVHIPPQYKNLYRLSYSDFISKLSNAEKT